MIQRLTAVIRPFLQPQLLAGALLVGAVLGMGAAWKMQDRAADLLADAKRINEATVPEAETDPPSSDVNREIIDNLDRAVVVRAAIDESLQQILEVVAGVSERQALSEAMVADARADLSDITSLLGRAVTAAEGSGARLRRTSGDIAVSRRLARLIAEELEELDRKMGPPLP